MKIQQNISKLIFFIIPAIVFMNCSSSPVNDNRGEILDMTYPYDESSSWSNFFGVFQRVDI